MGDLGGAEVASNNYVRPSSEVGMKSSLLTVLVASSLVALGACAGGDDAEDTNLDTVQEVAPPPAPAPMDSMAMDSMAVDTMTMDTTKTGM